MQSAFVTCESTRCEKHSQAEHNSICQIVQRQIFQFHMLLCFLPGFLPGTLGAAGVVRLAGLPFFCEVLQYPCQGDAKNACLTLVLFDRTRSTRAAKPCVRQSRHPANSSKWIESISSTPSWFATGYESRFE